MKYAGIILALFFVPFLCLSCEQMIDPVSSTVLDIPKPAFKISELNSKITEQNDVYWKYVWTAKINNSLARPQKVFITVQWLDAEGFEVDEQVLEYRLSRGENAVSDATLVRVPWAELITRYEVTVEKSNW